MSSLDYFERGRELYKDKKYKEAAEHFLLSIIKERSNVSLAWLADCYDVTFCAGCVQLPEKSLEALCIHELTHSFVRGHYKDFHDKMLELGGKEMCDLDKNLWKEDMWPYLKI